MKKNKIQLEKISFICKIIENLLDNILPSLIELDVELSLIRNTIVKEFDKHGITNIKNFVVDGLIVDDVCHISQGNQAVHGDGFCNKIKEGILKIDLVGFKDGMFGDAARSYVIGDSKEEKKLVCSAKTAFDSVLNFAKTGDYFYKISKLIHSSVKKDKYFVSPALGGHGIGENIHEQPFVSNYFDQKMTKKEYYYNFLLEKNMVFAVEPVVFSAEPKLAYESKKNKDQNTFHIPTVNEDIDTLIAHYENTIYFDEDGAKLISQYDGN